MTAMRLALLCAAVAIAVEVAPFSAASPAPRDAARARTADDPAAGLSWTLPRGWRPVRSQLTALVQPVHRLAAATFALR